MGFILKVLSWIGPIVFKAFVNIMRDETGKFYAKFRPAFIEGVQLASAITAEQVPDFWTRRRRQADCVFSHVKPIIEAELGSAGAISERLVYAAIELAVAEVKGGWVE